MKTASAAIAALIAVTALSPAAFALDSSPVFNRDDARVTSLLPASVLATVTDGGPLSASLESLDGVALDSGGELRARVSATNLTDVALEEVVLRLELTDQPLANRPAVADFLADPTGVPMKAAAQEPPVPQVDDEEQPDGAAEADNVTSTNSLIGAKLNLTTSTEVDDEPPTPVGVTIAPSADRSFTLEVAAADLQLPAQGWGVYGATLTLVTADAEVLVDSFPLTWGAQAVPQLDLAVLATASGVPSRVLSVLEASNLPGVAVAVDPAHVSPTSLFTAELREREVFRLPTHSPDLTSLAHAGNETLLPLSLSLPQPPTVSAVTSAPWLAIPAAVDGQSVALAARSDAAGILALPSAPGFSQLAIGASTPVVQAAGAPVLLPDATLSDTVTQYRPGTPSAAALAVADSALVAGEQAGTPTLVTLDSQWHIGKDANATLNALLDAPWVSTVPVSSVLEGSAPAVDIAESLDSDSDLPAQHIESLDNRLDSLTVLATVTEFPEVALGQWGSELLRGISVELRGKSAPNDLAARHALDNADATLAALRIADSSDLNLLTESGDIPINLVNNLDYDVTVTVHLNSYSSNLQVLDMPTVTVPAASDQVVLVPVEAVSTANVFMMAVLRNVDSDAVSDMQPFSIRVRADWGNAATAVFTVVLLLLLVAGLIRTIRRGRKDTREEPSAPPETMDGDDG